MIGEAELDGVFIPYLLILTILAFLALLPLRWLLRRLHFYRFVWHAGLFDTALYLVLLWLIALGSTRMASAAWGS
jgi:protein AaeX